MKVTPQRHRDTEIPVVGAGFKPAPTMWERLCLCASVVNRRTAATAQLVVILLVGLAVLPAAVAADMTGAEIEAALAGNTTDGVWGEASAPYRQYFGDIDGTSYRQARSVYLTRNLTEWPYQNGQTENVGPSDGCRGNAVPLTAESKYDFHEL